MARADPAELRQRRLAEDHRARFAQPRDRRRIGLHRGGIGGERAAPRGKILEPHIVLHGCAETVGDAERLTLLPARLGRLRGFQRALAIDDDEGIDDGLKFLDARELVARDFNGRKLALAIEAEEFGRGEGLDAGHWLPSSLPAKAGNPVNTEHATCTTGT